MIRQCTISEVAELTALCKGFEKSSKFITVDVEKTIPVYQDFISCGAGVMFRLDVDGKLIGGLGALKYPDLHNPSCLLAVETFWYVDPNHRGKESFKLLDAYEKWAKDQGCEKCAMIHMVDSHPDSLGRVYERRGYVLVEKHYVKELKS